MDRRFMRQTRKTLFRGRYIDWSIRRERGSSGQTHRRSRFRTKHNDDDNNNAKYDDDDNDDDDVKVNRNVVAVNLNRYSTFYLNAANRNKNADTDSKPSEALQRNVNAEGDGYGQKEAYER